MHKDSPQVVSDRALWCYVKATLRHYARMFDLPLKRIKLLSPKKDFYGDCSGDGVIRIQIRRGKQRLLPYQIIDTLSHELAHLQFNNHKSRWFTLHVSILMRMGQNDEYRKLKRLCKKHR